MRGLLVAGLGLLLSAGAASAQGPQGRFGQRPNYGPGYRGNISPYLNIARGNNTGINYYLGTRSEEQRRQQAREFSGDIAGVSELARENRQFITTGTTPVPNTMQRYFGNLSGFFAQPGPAFRR